MNNWIFIASTIIMKTTAHIMNVHSLIYIKMVLALLEFHKENGVGGLMK